MPDKVNRFNKDCSAVITAATCQIWWKFVSNFYSYNKNLWLTFCGHSVQGKDFIYILKGLEDAT